MASTPDERIGKALREAENQLALIIEFDNNFEKWNTDHTRQSFADEIEQIIQSITSQTKAIRLSGAEAWISLRRHPGDLYSVEAVRFSFGSQAVQRVTLANLRAKAHVIIPTETFVEIAHKMRASVLSREQDRNLRFGPMRLLYDEAYKVTGHYPESAREEFTKIRNKQYGSLWTVSRPSSR